MKPREQTRPIASRATLARLSAGLLAGLLAAAAAQASSKHPLEPDVTILRDSPDAVQLRIVFPGFYFARQAHPRAGAFLTPVIPGCGPTESIGAPALPAFRRFVTAPADATVRLSARGAPARLALLAPHVQALFPRQRPLPKGPRSAKDMPFDFDLDVFTADRFFPETPCRLVEAGRFAGQRLILLEVFPLAFHPRSQALRAYPALDITLDFIRPAGAKSTGQAPLQPAQDRLLSALTINDPLSPAAAQVKNSLPRLLILAPPAYHAALAPLVALREARGWAVDLLASTAAGATPAAIRDFIQTRYANPDTRPDALLLAGDTGQVPCFTGNQADNPDTDLYYACMDGADDWQPEFPVGRLSAASAAALTEIVDKILAFETAPPADWLLQASFMAGEDNHAITEGTHNAVIADWFEPLGYRSDRLFSISYNATTPQVSAAFNEGRILGVYSGHGDVHYWADGPLFQKTHVNALTNDGRYPLILSFSCLTGKFSAPECFAETWQRAPRKGAVGVLASSVTSYWDEDDVFERVLFDAIFNEGFRRFGDALLRAKYRLIETYGATRTVKRYFEQYNFFGDPLTPLREPALGIATPPELPTALAGVFYQQPLTGIGGLEPYAWSLAGGAPPPALTLHPESGLLAGVPDGPVTGLTFTVQITDSLGASTTRLFRLHVAPENLRIASGLEPEPVPAGQPFAAPLEAAGGIGPYSWRLLHNGKYTAWTNSGAWVWTPPRTARGWNGDERTWKVMLPWRFPFFGRSYARLFINSNGYLDFRSSASEWDNTVGGLADNARIAPLWDDLRTTNIYVRIQPNRAVIRWTGNTFATRTPVDFQATLQRNGRILFAYRAAGGKLSPTIGVSAGDGVNYSLAPVDGWPAIPRGTGVKFAWRPPLPEGVALQPDGVLTGTVANAGSWSVPIEVSDRSVPAQSVSAPLILRVE